MALDALQEQMLRSIDLDRFLTQHNGKYRTMAEEAYDFTAQQLQRSNQIVRPDDVSGHLEAVVELDEDLKVYLARKRKTQRYWTRYFTYLILDRLWRDLEDGHAERTSGAGSP